MIQLKGAKVPHRKRTAACAPVRMDCPTVAVYPMVQHIGAPAVPVVKTGDPVYVGTLLAEAGGFVSAPIYSGVSGVVQKLDDVLMSNGTHVTAVVVKPDGEMKPDPAIAPPSVSDAKSFIDAVRASGAVGLGGAGFPTAVKLQVGDPARIEEVIINGAECEPYISSDTRTMLDRVEDVREGIALLENWLGVKKIIIGIEKNKPECIKEMKKLAEADSKITVCALPSVYPQGGEKVLIYHTTGKKVPEGGLPIDVGVVVLNCTTLAVIASYMRTGMPLVEKCITVDGSAVREPKNVIAPIGTPIGEVFEFCGGFKEAPGKILFGGPMMGTAVPGLDAPVLKQTNALIAMNEKDAAPVNATNCIRCGRCTNVCPLGLAPVSIAAAYSAGNMEGLYAVRANLCMECGCCSYVCPAKRPLVQQNKLAKAALAGWMKTQKEKAKG